MDILFIGQRGIPAIGNSSATASERRVEALAVQLARTSHTVAVTCARSFTVPALIRYNGVELLHRFALRSSISRDLLHGLLCCVAVWRRKPTIVHTHGWLSGALLPLSRLLSPFSVFVWTIDALPRRYYYLARWIARRAEQFGTALTVPSRSLQYQLLYYFGVRAAYVPDGYTPPAVPDIPLRSFGVRKNQYTLALVDSLDDLPWIAQAYAACTTRKKLVVVLDKPPRGRPRTRSYPFLHFVGVQHERPLRSLLRNAAVVVVGGQQIPAEMILQAMEAQRAIVSIAHPLYEEILGTTAQFVSLGNIDDLSMALGTVLKQRRIPIAAGKHAQRRARAHFQWPRVAADYLILYRSPLAHRVSMDSVRQPSFTQVITTERA